MVLELRARRQLLAARLPRRREPVADHLPDALQLGEWVEAADAAPQPRVVAQVALQLQGLTVVRQRGDEQGADGLTAPVVP